jgi:hypothetical protein
MSRERYWGPTEAYPTVMIRSEAALSQAHRAQGGESNTRTSHRLLQRRGNLVEKCGSELEKHYRGENASRLGRAQAAQADCETRILGDGERRGSKRASEWQVAAVSRGVREGADADADADRRDAPRSSR